MLSYRWLLSSGCIALLLSGCGQTKSLTSGEIAQQVKASLVLISYQDRGGNGTGFFVPGGKDVCTLVTARHVVAVSEKLQVQTPDRKLIKNINIQRFPDHDLAVLTFKPEGQNCPYPALSLGNSDSLKVGEKIYINGFPARGGRLVLQFVADDVSAIENPALADGYGIAYDANTAGGMSGGPVLNTAGQVIAVHGRADTEVTRLVELKGGELPQQQQQASVSNNAAEVVAQFGTFKWGIPINFYVANVDKVTATPVTSAKTAEDWLNQGNDLIASQKYEEAIAAYDKAINIKPDYDLAWYSRGWALHQLQQYDEAIYSYQKANEIKPNNAELWYNKGWTLEKMQRYEDALLSYDKALKIKPDYAFVWSNRGSMLWYLKRYQEALTSYEKAVELKSDYSGAWYGRGVVLSSLTQYVNAISSYEKAIQVNGEWGDKSTADAWNAKGFALRNLERYEDAIASYDKAIQFKPDFHEAWNNRGVALSYLERYEDAIASFDKAIQFKSDYHEAWYGRGYALGELKRYEDAIASYDKAIQFKSDYSYAWNGKGYALEQLKRYDEAIECYNKAIKFDPNFQAAINNRKNLLTKLGRSQ